MVLFFCSFAPSFCGVGRANALGNETEILLSHINLSHDPFRNAPFCVVPSAFEKGKYFSPSEIFLWLVSRGSPSFRNFSRSPTFFVIEDDAAHGMCNVLGEAQRKSTARTITRRPIN